MLRGPSRAARTVGDLGEEIGQPMDFGRVHLAEALAVEGGALARHHRQHHHHAQVAGEEAGG